MEPTKNYLRFSLFACAVIFAWGLSWPLMKLTLNNIPPIWMGAMRMGIGSLLLFMVLFITGRDLSLSKKDIPFILSIGFLQMGIFILLVNLGLERVDAGRSAILVYTTPLWVTPIAVIFFKEPLHKLTIFGLVMGLFGILLLFNPFTFNWLDKTALHGNGFLLLAAFIWAFVIIHIRFGTHHRNTLELAPWQMLLATVTLSIIGVFLEPNPTINWSWSLLAEMSYLGPVATAFAYWGMIEISRQLPPIKTSIILLAVPVIGFVSSALILHEQITINLIIAFILILIGLICVTLDKTIKLKLATGSVE